MAHRDIVVIGASLGGVETLPRLVAGFPPDLRRLSRGPKESHARPSVDVLFRSAAAYESKAQQMRTLIDRLRGCDRIRSATEVMQPRRPAELAHVPGISFA